MCPRATRAIIVARAKLDSLALRRLVGQTAAQLEAQAKDAWLWHGRHCKLVDGFTFTLPDTPANQEAFPQMKSQKPGVGFPIARACAVLSLATAAIHDLGVGPYEGKETGETALFAKSWIAWTRATLPFWTACSVRSWCWRD